jgi:hypothetical protein
MYLHVENNNIFVILFDIMIFNYYIFIILFVITF